MPFPLCVYVRNNESEPSDRALLAGVDPHSPARKQGGTSYPHFTGEEFET